MHDDGRTGLLEGGVPSRERSCELAHRRCIALEVDPGQTSRDETSSKEHTPPPPTQARPPPQGAKHTLAHSPLATFSLHIIPKAAMVAHAVRRRKLTSGKFLCGFHERHLAKKRGAAALEGPPALSLMAPLSAPPAKKLLEASYILSLLCHMYIYIYATPPLRYLGFRVCAHVLLKRAYVEAANMN